MNRARPRPAPEPAAGWEAPPGVLVVDKAQGPTSHDVVLAVRRRLRAPGAGHAGTLDPFATGLLLVATGAATRCIPVWQGGDKTYEAVVRFGVTTDTQDLTGQVRATRPVALGADRIRDAAAALTGDLLQVPPMVSALRHRGERLHALARRGETVARAPRPVRVDGWEWLSFELPEARFRVRCSSGTYVRTLAHDLGERLGCGAALAALRRLRSEPFGLERAVSSAALSGEPPEAVWAAAGIPLDRALEHLPALDLTAAEAREIGFGRAPLVPRDRLAGPAAARLVLRDPAGRVLALAETAADGDAARVLPRVVFPWAVREGAR